MEYRNNVIIKTIFSGGRRIKDDAGTKNSTLILSHAKSSKNSCWIKNK